MTLTELIDTLFPPGHPNRPTPEQEAILRHPHGPAWVLAGPGSGKTEVLTLLVLRLLYVENDPAQSEPKQPEAIFVTTFTEKAARNLEDRISHYRNQIVAQRPDLMAIDISKLRLGTLPLCQRSCRPDRIGTFGGADIRKWLDTDRRTRIG
jgi:DNA helicase II / ATP-dependent DNA helicase PcrA